MDFFISSISFYNKSLLYEVTEALNYSELYKAYSTTGRNPAIDPKSLFKIIIYGYTEGVYSSRELEKAYKRDVNFRWLLEGKRQPENNTFARFKSERLKNCIEDLFSQFIIRLRELNKIKFENIFIGGTKIEANANRYSFVWKKSTDKFGVKLQEKIRTILESITSEIQLEFTIPENKITVDFINTILKKLLVIKD